MGHLVDALEHRHPTGTRCWVEGAARDEVSRQLVLTRIIESVSKLDSLRGAGGTDASAPSYRTVADGRFHRAKFRRTVTVQRVVGDAYPKCT